MARNLTYEGLLEKVNSFDEYGAYVVKHLDEALWLQTIKINTKEAYENYLKIFPKGLYLRGANYRIDNFVVQEKQDKDKIERASRLQKEKELQHQREIEEKENKAKEEKRQQELEKQGIVIIDGLMYQNQPFTKTYTWEEAKEYAKDLRLGGYDDWRLPTKDELMKLGNIKLYNYDNYDNWKKWFENNNHKQIKNSKGNEHFIRKEFSENMPQIAWFWSITENNIDSSSAWFVYFYYGSGYCHAKSNESYALCVRGQ